MSYLDEERQAVQAIPLQADWLEDIAKSLRIISGRTSLKEDRLNDEIEKLYTKMGYIYELVERDNLQNKIDKLEAEIVADRLNREKLSGGGNE